ncbi:murein biosynthesis integral membrane protein MurJ [Pseudomonas duriflava]|uniref:Murein biosynthesis integral membrane protein MurJ n=1 Tax=Pseudomonas duriflava TaxID=459528 RepID=A0A562QIT2_9PSED|nr:lipid II flippase MurJ [Pseudomonas duriflava]TWI56667.1 murein biosynthesis integral membrane protein MurJ [Pseudomonas duriflava]
MKKTVIILMITVASFLLGFLRDLIIAKEFGLSWEADLIFVALVLPLFFENFFGLALRDAMIPYLQRIRSKSESQFILSSRWLYWRVMLFGLLVSLGAALGSPWVLKALAPGWSAEQVEAGLLVFSVGAFLIFVQAILYCQGALLSLDRIFILPMARTVTMNLGAIIGIYAFYPSGIYLFSGMLIPQVILIFIQHRRIGYLTGLAVPEKLESRGFEFAITFAPVLAAAGAQQGCMLAERFFASFLAEGSISMLSFSFRIVTIPLTLYTLSILAVMFPDMAKSWSDKNHEHFTNVLHKTSLATLLFLVPASVVLLSFPEPVVKILLERGAFGAEQTVATASLVTAYALGLPWMGLALMWGRALLAQQRQRAFLLATLFSSGVTILLDISLYKTYGAEGLAYSLSVGSFIQALLMAWLLYRAAPNGVSLTVLLRWAVSATSVTVAAFYMAPEPNGLIQLVLYISSLLVCLLVCLLILGERDLFRRSYWTTIRSA